MHAVLVVAKLPETLRQPLQNFTSSRIIVPSSAAPSTNTQTRKHTTFPLPPRGERADGHGGERDRVGGGDRAARFGARRGARFGAARSGLRGAAACGAVAAGTGAVPACLRCGAQGRFVGFYEDSGIFGADHVERARHIYDLKKEIHAVGVFVTG